jgi:hypothetical protein
VDIPGLWVRSIQGQIIKVTCTVRAKRKHPSAFNGHPTSNARLKPAEVAQKLIANRAGLRM